MQAGFKNVTPLPNNPPGSDEPHLCVDVRHVQGAPPGVDHYTVVLPVHSTVFALKVKVMEHNTAPPRIQEMYFRGRLLKDEESLTAVGVDQKAWWDGKSVSLYTPPPLDRGITK